MGRRPLYTAIFLLALALRGGYLLLLGCPGTVMLPGERSSELYDSIDYHRLACSLLDHGVYGYGGRASSYRPPAYPALLAGIYAAAGRSPLAVRIAQALLGAATCVLLAAAAGSLAGTAGAAAAGILAAFHPFFIFYSMQLLSETPAVFLAGLILFLFTRKTHRKAVLAAAGAVWGLAALTRSTFLPLAALPAACLLLRRPRQLRGALLFAAGLACTVGPWTLRNYALHGRFVPVSTNGGYNFYLGSAGYGVWSGREGGTLPSDAPHSDTVMESLMPPAAETAADRDAYRAGFAFIRAHPVEYVKNAIIKMYDFWHIFLAGEHGVAAVWGIAAYLLVLLAAGGAGIYALYRTSCPGFGAAAGWFLLASTMLHAVFISNIRMRVPLADPLLVLTAAAGLPYLFTVLLRRRAMRRGIPVLMYHAVAADTSGLARLQPVDRPFAVLLGRFRRQLDLLAEHGYRTVDGIDVPDGGTRQVMLTFDDGYDDFYRLALPELEKRGMSATLFMTSGYLDREGYLSTAQLKACAERGVRIGSHGHSHRFLSLLDERGLAEELGRSRTVLERATGRTVDSLSLPGGRGADRMPLFRQAGFTRVFTSRTGRAVAGDAGTGIRRIPVRFSTTDEDYMKMITGDPVYCGWIELAEALKRAVRTVTGDRLYDRLYALRQGKGAV